MKVWVCALLIILACAQPTSSRAYFKYVPPQPPAERYKVVRVLKAKVSRYIKPERRYYSSDEEYNKAKQMNGNGKRTIFGTAPKANFTIAADLDSFERGTILRITGKIKGKTFKLVGRVEDRCAAAEKRWGREGVVQFDVFSKMHPKKALAWGMPELEVEVLKEI